ncbi:hypothetical protein [Nocardia sp. NPDC052316]|uniref:hypothetical protein n=1 Tax=Nocardia sp. NPDC052316 TaxID=3364329 RepID=UPI0037C6C202
MSAPETTANNKLLEVTADLRECVQHLWDGGSAELTSTALSGLVADTARLYAASSTAAGHELDIDPGSITATEAVMLIAALMRAQNLNTFDLALWMHQLDRETKGAS